MTALMHAGYAQSMSGVVGPVSPASAGNSSSGGGASWKRQIIGQIHQRNQKEVTAYADVFGAYTRMLQSHRALKTRAFQLEQEVMTTRQLSSLSATPGGGGLGGRVGEPGGGLGQATQKLLEEKILKLQEDLTSAYRLQSENSNTFLRLKEQAEKDEKALLKKEEESVDNHQLLAEQTRQAVSLRHALQSEREGAKERSHAMEQTLDLLRGEVQSSRALVKSQETKLREVTEENASLMTAIIKLREEQDQEQSQLNTVRLELLRANAEAKLAAERAAAAHAIAPVDIDMSDTGAVIDHVAWTSNHTVLIPNERRRTIRAHRGPVTCMRYNNAGTLFASAGVDGVVKIYDARSGGNRASLRGTKESVMNLAFSPDDSLMLASGNDNISRVWSLRSSRVQHTLVGHTSRVWASCFTSDGSKAITGSHDRTLKIWDLHDGACKKSILCQSSCNYLSIDREDNMIATAHLDTHVRFWSMKTGELMHVMEDIHNGQATSVEFSRDGTLVVTCSRDNTVKITDIRTYKVLQVLEGSSRAPFRNLINWNRAIFSPDDAHVVAGGHAGELFFWNVDSGKLETVLPGVAMSEGLYGAGVAAAPAPTSSAAVVAAANAVGEQAIPCVDWNRNGRQVMSCDHGGNIHVWEYEAK